MTVMPLTEDPLSAIAPYLRVRPELQDFCRFGGDWSSPHEAGEPGWAYFHIVTRGQCQVERAGQPAVELGTGDILLLPHGDAHVVFGGAAGRHILRDMLVTYRNAIRIKQTVGSQIETELVCGRLGLEASSENILLSILPQMIVLRPGAQRTLARCGSIVEGIRDELDQDRAGAAAIARDLASALFVMMLRHHIESDPPADGLLALLSQRDTGRAAAAMMREPARDWSLDELAALAAVSRATLVRAFQRIAKVAPSSFLTELRLGIARARIAQTSDGLGEIAGHVGYQSEAALSRALYRRFGVSRAPCDGKPRGTAPTAGGGETLSLVD